MKSNPYPFSAIVGQEQMKLALLLGAVDWRVSVLLRGDKGAGKTTAARALAGLLPRPAPFINLPIGTTEDRLLGGLHLERALRGEPALKPGLVAEAHGGVLYVDEINLLPAHLGDALLDTVSSGLHIVEREGLSASHPAEFVLLGSMNPEEGSLRPQLLDRFALAVAIAAPLDPAERQTVVERRLAFEQAPGEFHAAWHEREQQLSNQLMIAREQLPRVRCESETLKQIITAISALGVRSLRADLAAVRASVAYAALLGDEAVEAQHFETVLPLVLAHRAPERSQHRERSQPPVERQTTRPEVPAPAQDSSTNQKETQSQVPERLFATRPMGVLTVEPFVEASDVKGTRKSAGGEIPGAVIGSRRSEMPMELDVRATLTHAVLNTGRPQINAADLHERIRKPRSGTRYLLLIDSSGSHATRERMRLVKGAASSLLTHSFKAGDEIAILAFRGTAAQVILEPCSSTQDALAALEYLPTGGRTPLSHALLLAQNYTTPETLLVILTDGRANVAVAASDPWQEALGLAAQVNTPCLVIDTEDAAQPLGRSRELATALKAEYVLLAAIEEHGMTVAMQRLRLVNAM